MDLVFEQQCNSIWPLTIVRDRYSGTYSGGNYTAWNLEADCVPWEINAGDADCAGFWWDRGDSFKSWLISVCGKGDTAAAAVADLYSKLNK